MALWSLLGARGVDVLAWESFGAGWVTDVTKQLKLKDVRLLEAPYGALPDLAEVDFDRDVVFAWNGTTSGVRVPNGDWIAATARGSPSATPPRPSSRWSCPGTKLDVVTWSWQKVLGGEAAARHARAQPRAVERFESISPPGLCRRSSALQPRGS